MEWQLKTKVALVARLNGMSAFENPRLAFLCDVCLTKR